MAIELPILVRSYEAGSDLSTKQFYAVKLTAAGIVDVCSAETDISIGILQNNPAAGESASVMKLGDSKASAAGVIAVGDLLGVDANGQVESLTAPAATRYVIGHAEEAATAAGEIISASVSCMAPTRLV